MSLKKVYREKAGGVCVKKLTYARAVSCALMNQLATPGLGTLLAGRYLAGAVQLVLALVGFCGFLAWFLLFMQFYYGALIDGTAAEFDRHWIGKYSAALFVIAWFLALGSSVRLLREAKKTPASPPEL